jgi:hypothetical protein
LKILPVLLLAVTAAPVGTTFEFFPNGDFESGATQWTQGSSNGWPLILTTNDIGRHPHSGNWAAWLGGVTDEISVIEQLVPIPSDSPYLKYWQWIESEDDCGYDAAGVLVHGDTAVDAYWLCELENTGGWVLHEVDMSEWAGQSALVSIVVVTDGLYDSNLFVDDVFFEFEGDAPHTVFTDRFESGDLTGWDEHRP